MYAFNFDDFISIENNGFRPISTNISQKCYGAFILPQRRTGYIYHIAARFTIVVAMKHTPILFVDSSTSAAHRAV